MSPRRVLCLTESRGAGKERAGDAWGLERGFFLLGARETKVVIDRTTEVMEEARRYAAMVVMRRESNKAVACLAPGIQRAASGARRSVIALFVQLSCNNCISWWCTMNMKKKRR